MATRRAVISGSAAILICGATTGCWPLAGLLRFGVRGAAVRGGALAARASSRGNLNAFGRASAATLHAARMLRVAQAVGRLERVGEVFGIENGEQAFCMDADRKRVECSVDGVVVCSTHQDGKFCEHVSALYGSCGTSRSVSDNEIHHFDNTGAVAGYEVWEGGRIRHFGPLKQLLGETPLTFSTRPDGSTVALVERGGYMDRTLAEFNTRYRDAFGAAASLDVQSISDNQEACLARAPSSSCADLRENAAAALARLETRFRQFAS